MIYLIGSGFGIVPDPELFYGALPAELCEGGWNGANLTLSTFLVQVLIFSLL